jgi:ribosome biogenesis GTPase A
VRRREPHVQSITVGVVGYPNVRKSSLINSLKRAKVSAKPGHTQDLQSVQLERGICIVYSPGVIFDDDDDDGFRMYTRDLDISRWTTRTSRISTLRGRASTSLALRRPVYFST